MKTIKTLLIILLVVSMPIFANAWEGSDEVVLDPGTMEAGNSPSSVTPEQLNAAVNKGSRNLTAKMRKMEERQNEYRQVHERIESARYQVLSDGLAGLANRMTAEFNAVGDQMALVKAYVVGAIILGLLVGLVALLVYIFVFRRRSRNHIDRHVCNIHGAARTHEEASVERAAVTDEAIANLSAQLDRRADDLASQMRNGFTAMPQEVANAVRKLDDSPIEFEADGHVVTYKSPAGGINEGYYLELFVPKDVVGDPATYDRAPNSNRGVVRRNSARIMNKYFRGDFNASGYELQKALIEHLHGTGELTWTTR